MRISKEMAKLLLKEEAIVLSAYKDSGGVWTIGAGHTAMAGDPKPVPGMKLQSVQHAVDLFAKDIQKYERGVSQAISRPLKQHEFDALVSFHYNTGAIKSGSVDDKLNAGNVQSALDTLDAYDKDNGKFIPGLDARRKREINLFKTGAYPKVKTIPVYENYPGKVKHISADDLNFSAFFGSSVGAPVPPVHLPPDVEVPQAIPPRSDGKVGLLKFIFDLIARIFSKRK